LSNFASTYGTSRWSLRGLGVSTLVGAVAGAAGGYLALTPTGQMMSQALPGQINLSVFGSSLAASIESVWDSFRRR